MFKKINYTEDSFIIDTHIFDANGNQKKAKLKLTFRVPDYFEFWSDDKDYIKKNFRRYKYKVGPCEKINANIDIYIENDETGSVGYLLRDEEHRKTFDFMVDNLGVDDTAIKEYYNKEYTVLYSKYPDHVYIADITPTARYIVKVDDQFNFLTKKELRYILDYKIEIISQE